MTLQQASLFIVLPMFSLAVFAAAARLVIGPSLADRVVAFEMMATLGIGIVAVYSIVTGQPVFLDIALLLALISFLGTVAFAHFLGKRV